MEPKTPAHGLELQNTSAGHNKFYRIILTGPKVVTNYGRIAAGSGQHHVEAFDTVAEAGRHFTTRVREKARGGYKQTIAMTTFALDQATYDSLASRARSANTAASTAFIDAAARYGTTLPAATDPDLAAIRKQVDTIVTTQSTPAAAPAAPPANAAPRRPRPPRLTPVGPTSRPNGERYLPRTVGGRHEDVALLREAQFGQEHVLLSGPPGTGKTALLEAAFPDAEQLIGTADTTEADLVGTWIQDPATGNFAWAPGPLQRSIERNVPLFVDEIALIDPRVLSILYGVMDGRGELVITANPTLPPLKITPGWFVVGAYNPDVPGVQLSDALRDRFEHHIEVTSDFQMARELDVPNEIVTVAENLEKQRRDGQIRWSPQLRSLLTFKRQAERYGIDYAVASLVAKTPAEDRPTVTAALRAHYRGVTALALGRRFDA